MLDVGKIVPEFCLQDQDLKEVCIREFQGQKVVIYFYPKDNTPGCTTQACAFKAVYDQFEELGVKVIGISKDTVKSHQKFIQDFDLPFTLLADPKHQAIEIFGVMGEKMMYGKKVNSVMRTTFVLDETQTVEKVFLKASPENNALEILEYLKNK